MSSIEWTQANIAKFGGNPDQMSLWGHSAGSIAVDYYSFAYPTEPIVKGLIMDSGTAHLDQLVSPDTIHSNFTWVASNVGCANLTDAAAELACMRKVSAATIEDFLHAYEDSGVSPSITFAPTVDDVIIFGNYTERAALGALSTLVRISALSSSHSLVKCFWNNSLTLKSLQSLERSPTKACSSFPTSQPAPTKASQLSSHTNFSGAQKPKAHTNVSQQIAPLIVSSTLVILPTCLPSPG